MIIHRAGPLIFYNYKYDQLNRLTAQDAYNGFLRDKNQWDTSMSLMGESAKERIAYDANGNIQKYLRKSIEGGLMDNLNYYYYDSTNRLRFITDSVGDNVYDGGPDHLITDINGQRDSNYVYDPIGNLIADTAENITGIKWNVYGKIEEITRMATVQTPTTNIKYTYDAMGNRISQVVTAGGTKTIYLVCSGGAEPAPLCGGNIMSTYTADGNATDLASLDLEQSENFLYGSSRLGTLSIKEGVKNGPDNTEFYYKERAFLYERGHKQYELTNHLGNVLATISDKKFGVSSAGSSLIDHYEPDIVTAQDYYPFGMISREALPNSGVPYKFGFNGKLNDNDVKGGYGLQQDYGMRVYDSRVGRFLSVDPLSQSYPWNSPYSYSEGDPINYVDIDGAERGGATQQSIPRITVPTLSNWTVDKNGELVNPTQLIRTGPVNAGMYTPQTQFITQEEFLDKIPPGCGASINADGVTASVFNSNGNTWTISLLKTRRQITWVDRLTFGAQQERWKQISNQVKWNDHIKSYEIITTDPRTLPAKYLNDVEKRLLYGTASDQDRLYQGEITRRKESAGLKSFTIFEGESKTLVNNAEFKGTIRLEYDVLIVTIGYISKLNTNEGGKYSVYKSLIERAESIARENGAKTVKFIGFPRNKEKAEVPFKEAGYSSYQNPDKWNFHPVERTKTLE